MCIRDSHPGGELASADSQTSPPSSSLHSDMACPAADVLQSSASDVAAPAPEIVDDSLSENKDERTENDSKSDDIASAADDSPLSRSLPQVNVIADENSPAAEPDTSAAKNRVLESDSAADKETATDSDDTNKTAPCPRVVLRRESRKSESAAELAKILTPVAPVFELYLDTDFKRTDLADFELDGLSTDSGSAVQKLREFLEGDSAFSRDGLPTAVQPGKACDSLKYFLSTLN